MHRLILANSNLGIKVTKKKTPIVFLLQFELNIDFDNTSLDYMDMPNIPISKYSQQPNNVKSGNKS